MYHSNVNVARSKLANLLHHWKHGTCVTDNGVLCDLTAGDVACSIQRLCEVLIEEHDETQDAHARANGKG